MPCTHRRSARPRALREGRLRPGRAAAPGEPRLALLPSGPDAVRVSPLRGTRSSAPSRPAALEDGDLGWEFSPAGADCRYRAPLVPRLARHEDDSRGSRNGGGEGGIRTHDELPHTAFPVRRPRPLGDLSAGSAVAAQAGARGGPSGRDGVAERVGFEPTVLAHTAFRERHHQPLGHLSATEDSKGLRSAASRARRHGARRAAASASSAASDRRIPLMRSSRRERAGLFASWTTEPAAPATGSDSA